MNTTQFNTMREAIWQQAVDARNFATDLDNQQIDARTWHALADRLFEAADQIDNMDKVITPVNP